MSWQDSALKITALHCAAILGWVSCVETLIKAGADTSLTDGVRSRIGGRER